jgi:uncharacterized protein
VKVAVLGASGFVGRALLTALERRGDDVRTLSLRDPARAADAAGGSDVIVNLAGSPVTERWTAASKAEIARSRVDLPHAFLSALERVQQRPRAYVSASAVGYYGTSRTATFDESSPPAGDFLARVCAAWETEARHAEQLGMRVAILRTGVVLGANGGALGKLLPIFRLGFGGPIASGKQWLSWIHIDDHIALYLLAIDGFAGVLNATAPAPVTNAEFTRALAAAVHRPAFFTVPAFALALAFGEGATVLTEGQRVVPKAALDAGFTFRYADVAGALKTIV